MQADLFDVMRTCRAMRRFEDRDVPDEIVEELISLAVRAPSSGNSQNWAFIVVRDPAVKRALAVEISKGTRWKTLVENDRLASEVRAGLMTTDDEAKSHRILAAFNDLADRFDEVPVVICVCIGTDPTTKAVATARSIRGMITEFGLLGAIRFAIAGNRFLTQARWASAYPAVQNLLLAARGMGLGAVLTTPQLLGPPGRIEKVLGIPRGVGLAAVIPMGYPTGRFGPVRRQAPTVFEDRYGQS